MPGDLAEHLEDFEAWLRAAAAVAYALPPNGKLDDAYLAKAVPVITERLAKAAVRLAGVLNKALGPH